MVDCQHFQLTLKYLFFSCFCDYLFLFFISYFQTKTKFFAIVCDIHTINCCTMFPNFERGTIVEPAHTFRCLFAYRSISFTSNTSLAVYRLNFSVRTHLKQIVWLRVHVYKYIGREREHSTCIGLPDCFTSMNVPYT